MKYRTINELQHFSFRESYIADIRAMSGSFLMVFDNVTILANNSCNRDIRDMRTNGLELRIETPQILAVVEEGYKIFDANGNLKQQVEDREIPPEQYGDIFKELAGCEMDSIEKKETDYHISINTEDHTFLLKVHGTGDVEEWNRFLNLEG